MRAEHYQPASLKVRVPRGNAGFWQIICALDLSQGEFTIGDIDGESNVSREDIKGYVSALAKAGFLTVVRNGRSTRLTPTVYRLAKRQKLAPRVRPDGSLIHSTAQEQLWTAMRTLKTFGVRSLMFAAATPEVKPSYEATKRFINRLTRAGYLVALRANVPATWRLKPGMDTGPKPPERRALRADVLWDPNLGAFVGESPIAKEATR